MHDLRRKEVKTVVCGATETLLEKKSLKPKDIGVLIVDCILFYPVPSLYVVIVNHYELKRNFVS